MIKKDNVIINKSKDFAIEAIKLYKLLKSDKKEFILSTQFLRSATSIGANVREGLNSISKKEFVSKLNISLKEAYEVEYWLELLFETEYIDKKSFYNLKSKIVEIIRLLTAIIKTTIKNSKLYIAVFVVNCKL